MKAVVKAVIDWIIGRPPKLPGAGYSFMAEGWVESLYVRGGIERYQHGGWGRYTPTRERL